MRVLQVGLGRIGSEVFEDYRLALAGHEFMATDRMVPVPDGWEWDGGEVDLAVIVVDTPRSSTRGHLDHGGLVAALEEYLDVADFLLVRSTVEPRFLDFDVVRCNAGRIGFSPEFYGTTRHSRRGVVNLPFALFSDNVPEWFASAVCPDRRLSGSALEVVLAKLVENAFLATKVTFFHELALVCEQLGAEFDVVREMVTTDPRITPFHSWCDDEPGWSSHCFDKDVPVLAALGHRLIHAVCGINAAHLGRKGTIDGEAPQRRSEARAARLT